MRVHISTNSLANVPQEVYANHRAEWYRFGKYHPEYELLDWASKRLTIDRSRNETAKNAMSCACDYVIFVDDDMLLHPDTFHGLISDMEKYQYDILMAHTYIRGIPFQPMAFKNKLPENSEGIDLLALTDEDIDNAPDNGIVDCYAVGFAVCAVKVDVIRQVNPPYFVTGPGNTEDIYFCIKAKQEIGSHIKIGVHTKYPTAHLVDPIFIHKSNKKKLLQLFTPEELKTFRGDDRGLSYHERQSQA